MCLKHGERIDRDPLDPLFQPWFLADLSPTAPFGRLEARSGATFGRVNVHLSWERFEPDAHLVWLADHTNHGWPFLAGNPSIYFSPLTSGVLRSNPKLALFSP